MYSTCLRCDAAFRRNTDLKHLPVGRRIAFDTTRGRLWVVCDRCAQWNLAPLESRWEALHEADEAATAAEARAPGGLVGLARTASGLELLRVGGLPEADIANWRYGRQLERRHRRLRLLLAAIAVGTGALGAYVTWTSEAPVLGVWVAAVVGYYLFHLWKRPPQLAIRVSGADGRPRPIWFWRFNEVRLEQDPVGGEPVLVLPHGARESRLTGIDAARALTKLLPRFRAAEAGPADLGAALTRVGIAEGERQVSSRSPTKRRKRRGRRRERGSAAAGTSALRPWQRLISLERPTSLRTMPVVSRLALEMAVAEEIEQEQLQAAAAEHGATWQSEEEVGAIADQLLLPEAVQAKFDALARGRGDRTGGSDPGAA